MPFASLVEVVEKVEVPEATVGASDDSWEVTVALPSSLRCFEGHFPGAPLLPGIAQLRLVRGLVAKRLGQPLQLRQVVSARMTESLLPEDRCRLLLRATPWVADQAEDSGEEVVAKGGWRVTAQIFKGPSLDKRCSRLTLWLGS